MLPFVQCVLQSVSFWNSGVYYCYCYYCYVIVIVVFVVGVVSCHMPYLPGTFPEPTVISTAHASSFRLQHFPYYV